MSPTPLRDAPSGRWLPGPLRSVGASSAAADPPAGFLDSVTRRPRQRGAAVALLLAVFAALCLHGARWDSPTVDEFAHLPAGYAYWRTASFDLYAANPPLVKLLMALPLLALDPPPDLADPATLDRGGGWRPQIYGTDFMERNRERYRLIFLLGRLPIIGLGLALGLLIHRWASQAYGGAAGLVALVLFAFSPTFVAHSHLATIDVGAALFSTLTLYCFWRTAETGRAPWLIATGLALGCAQLSKFSALLLYPLLLLLTVAFAIRGTDLAPWIGRRRPLATTAALLALCATSAAVIWCGYLGTGALRPLADFPLHSRGFSTLRTLWPQLPVPLPAAYFQGLDEMLLYGEVGEFPSYLFGEWSADGFPHYYLVSLLFKTPLPLLVAWVVAPRLGGRHRRLDVLLLLPALTLFGFFSLSRLGYGIRYLLPALPLLMIYAARSVPALSAGRVRRQITAAALVVYAASAVATTPDTIDYVNLLVRGPTDAVFLDSNLDWGQGLERLHAFLAAQHRDTVGLVYFGHVDPAIYGIEAHRPDPRRDDSVVVSANFLRGYPYLTYRDGKMTPVSPASVAWLAELPRQRYLGGGLWLVGPTSAAIGAEATSR